MQRPEVTRRVCELARLLVPARVAQHLPPRVKAAQHGVHVVIARHVVHAPLLQHARLLAQQFAQRLLVFSRGGMEAAAAAHGVARVHRESPPGLCELPELLQQLGEDGWAVGDEEAIADRQAIGASDPRLPRRRRGPVVRVGDQREAEERERARERSIGGVVQRTWRCGRDHDDRPVRCWLQPSPQMLAAAVVLAELAGLLLPVRLAQSEWRVQAQWLVALQHLRSFRPNVRLSEHLIVCVRHLLGVHAYKGRQ
mmetsp:Transcript_15888/g.39812  ORF Transcript_15888/g.39812 Transcript_15888/m.39812 type:complete len:254 (-) Transcript_15888:234-995(-)